MDNLVNLIAGASKNRNQNGDCYADRLSSRYTVVLLVMFAVLTTMNSYVRNPITCWAPTHFTGAHTKFATQYCWIKNTYYLPWDQEVPRAADDAGRQMIPYYQWVSIILLLQAVFFYLPSTVWHVMNSKAGVDADNILEAAHSLSRTEKMETQEKTLQVLAKHMDRFLDSRQTREECGCGVKCFVAAGGICSRRFGGYLLVLFLISKMLYITNILVQLFLLNKVLAMKYNTFGFDMLNNMAGSKDWTEDESYVAFPRVTFCDFDVRGQDMANTMRYTIQCVLPINMYNEKIYLFLWFWMLFVLVASIISFFLWLARAIHCGDRIKFIKNHLRLGGRLTGDVKSELIRKFTINYLRQDGAFIMRLIAHNTDNVTTTEVICTVWDSWKESSVSSNSGGYPYAQELKSLSSLEPKG